MSFEEQMSLISKTEELERPSHEKNSLNDQLLYQMQTIIRTYLQAKSTRSVNGLSKKCNVSEPTLRRVMSGKIKTLPQVTTVLDILTFIAGTNSIRKIIQIYSGPIADFLLESMPHLKNFDQDYSNSINKELKDPIKYLIYKLSLNGAGVAEEKVLEMYGQHGLQLLNEMLSAGYIAQEENRVYRAKAKSFSSSHEDFVRNFKLVADFIKPDKYQNRKPLNPIFLNASDSINSEAYEQIRRLQKSTQKKILKILNEEGSKGEIPIFYICGFDTLDPKGARELIEGI